tara:strand:- start:1920 stop:2645 length:726 start_codon:yes stop_codon:yes gene_type:complete
MNTWSLKNALSELHDELEERLKRVRKTTPHPGTMGDSSENVWLGLLKKYLPERYRADKAQVVDSAGNISDQIDVVIYDRQYSPFIFHLEAGIYIPAESVYAVFEAKQTANLKHVGYAKNKVASVRRLKRTSLPIPHAGGTYPAKPLIPILGGLLSVESEWSPPLGKSLHDSLQTDKEDERLQLGCIASRGFFHLNKESGDHVMIDGGKAATQFLFKLISELQFSGTVPMIDIQAYAAWLDS